MRESVGWHNLSDQLRSSFAPVPVIGAWRLRLAIAINSVTAIVAYGTVDPQLPTLVLLVALLCGSIFSYAMRFRRNLALKWLLAIAMLVALYQSLRNMVFGAMELPLALGQLLVWLQVMNSWDLPRLTNLRVATMVAGVLMVVTGSLHREAGFLWFVLAFVLSLFWGHHEAWRDELRVQTVSGLRTVGVLLLTLVLMLPVALPVFVVAPRGTRSGTQHRPLMSLSLGLPATLDARIRQSVGPSRTGGRQTQRDGNADHRFDTQLEVGGQPVLHDRVIMRVNSPHPHYWRAMAFDHYDGRKWRMRDPDAVKALSPDNDAFNPPIQPAWRGEPELQTYYVEQDSANLIFSALQPQLIYFPSGLIWLDDYAALRSPFLLQAGMYYSVRAVNLALTRAELARLPLAPRTQALAPYLDTSALTPRVKALVRPIQGETPFQTMGRLSEMLATRCTYRLDVPKLGPGKEATDHFLFVQRSGFCEHFATTLAMTARVAGIPTRLVTGYAPGRRHPLTGLHEVTGRDAHAWVEAYLPSVGWIPFEATPGWSMPAPVDSDTISPPLRRLGELFVWIRETLGTTFLTLIFLLPLASYLLIRAKRRKAQPSPHPASKPFRALKKELKRHGVTLAPNATSQDILEQLTRYPDLAPCITHIQQFLEQYEFTRFAKPEESPSQQALQTQWHQLRQRLRTISAGHKPHRSNH